MTPRSGTPRWSRTSSGVFSVLSRYSRKNAVPAPRRRPRSAPSRTSRTRRGRTGSLGHGGRVDDADVRGLQLGGDVRLLRAGEQAVEHLARRVDLALLRVVADALAAEVEGLVLGRLERGGDARLLRRRRLVVVLGGAHDALGLGADLLARLVDLVADLEDLGVALDVLLEELRLLALEARQLDAQRLDEAAAHDLGQLLGVRRAGHLPPERLLLQPLRLQLVERGAELLELLVEQRAALLDVDDVGALLEPLQAALELLDLLPLLVDLRAEPLARLGRTCACAGRGSAGCRAWRARSWPWPRARGWPLVTDTVTSRLLRIGPHAQAREERRRSPFSMSRLCARRLARGSRAPASGVRGPPYSGLGQQVQLLDDVVRERAALQQLVLRLVVVVAAGVDLLDLLEVEDRRVAALDQELRRALVDGAREERPQRRQRRGRRGRC